MTSEVLAREELDIDWLEGEFQKRMDEKGYVLLWSELFQDYVAFYMRDDVLEHIPDKYVTYSDQELKDLFSEGKRLSQKMLKQQVELPGFLFCRSRCLQLDYTPYPMLSM